MGTPSARVILKRQNVLDLFQPNWHTPAHRSGRRRYARSEFDHGAFAFRWSSLGDISDPACGHALTRTSNFNSIPGMIQRQGASRSKVAGRVRWWRRRIRHMARRRFYRRRGPIVRWWRSVRKLGPIFAKESRGLDASQAARCIAPPSRRAGGAVGFHAQCVAGSRRRPQWLFLHAGLKRQDGLGDRHCHWPPIRNGRVALNPPPGAATG